MFCERCGTQLPDTADFCAKCGTSTARGGGRPMSKKMTDTQIQLRLQPTFKFGYMVLIPAIISIIIISFFSLLFAFGIADDYHAFFIFFVTVFLFIAPTFGIIIAIDKKQYDNTCFDFYKTKVIYKDRFLNLSEKEVKYEYIREVIMQQTFIQKYFDIGNIILFTSAETAYRNGGICIENVENVQDVYRNLKSIINI